MSYYNTTNQTGAQLDIFHGTARNQEARFKATLRHIYVDFSPEDAHVIYEKSGVRSRNLIFGG